MKTPNTPAAKQVLKTMWRTPLQMVERNRPYDLFLRAVLLTAEELDKPADAVLIELLPESVRNNLLILEMQDPTKAERYLDKVSHQAAVPFCEVIHHLAWQLEV